MIPFPKNVYYDDHLPYSFDTHSKHISFEGSFWYLLLTKM